MATAIVLAAGAATRMGRPKATLPLHGATALARIAAASRAAGVDVLVVTGAHRDATEAEAVSLGLETVYNPRWESGQTTSFQAGWRDAGDVDAFLWPVDVPLVRTGTLAALLAAARPDAAAVPVHDGRRGHPPLLGRALRPDVLALAPDAPLHAVVRPHAVDVPVDDPAVRVDLDTPEDHARAEAHLLRGEPLA